MFVPLPVLIVGAVAVLGLLAWALLRGCGERRRDLTGPPPHQHEAPVRHGQDGMTGGTAPPAIAGPKGAFVDLIDELRDEIWKLVHTGHTINAIKLVRDRTGLGLKEAKDLVDGLRRDEVTLR